jgi:hypothetical protein
MAQGSTSATQAATMEVNINGVSLTLDKDFNRFYGTKPVSGVLPATISVTATDSGKASVPNTLEATLKDLVTIDKAEARCSFIDTIKTCALTVQATSSDDESIVEQPVTLTLQHPEAYLSSCVPSITHVCVTTFSTSLAAGVATTVKTTAGLPAAVTVVSSKGGVAVKPVTILNN